MSNKKLNHHYGKTDVVCGTGIGNEYLNFLENKKALGNFWILMQTLFNVLFDFQKSIIEKDQF